MNTQNFSNWIEVEDGTLVKFSDLPHIIGNALFPGDDDGCAYGGARISLEKELLEAVRNGELIVRNALTRGVHDFPYGDALQRAVILPHELRTFLAARGIGLRVIPSESPTAALPILTPKAAPANEPRALAARKGLTKEQILTAFDGPGVKINLKKAMGDGATLWLRDARISKGSRGRGGHQAQWDPLILAVALWERKHATKDVLNRAFFQHTFLADWREEWKEQEENLV